VAFSPNPAIIGKTWRWDAKQKLEFSLGERIIV
jgi:hypothetical protein